jgi:hypothetical protein
MAVAYQAIGTPNAVNRGTLVCAWPTHAIGDIGFLAIEVDADAATFSVSGWTHVSGSPVTGTSTKLQVYYRVATSAAEADVSNYNGGTHQFGVIATVRGAASVSPINATATGTTDGQLPALTTTAGNCAILTFVARGDDDAGAQFSVWSYPSTSALVEVLDEGTTEGAGGGLGIAWGQKISTGSTSTGSVTYAGASTTATIVVAIRPSLLAGSNAFFMGADF